MANPYFQFKKFTVYHDQCAMKVTTDACLFGAWCAQQLQQETVSNALDIGTGSGLLSLMVAQKNDFRITAIEIDQEAAQQSQCNFEKSIWKEQISSVCADVLQHTFPQRLDVIFSNPPFYENELESPDAKRNTAHHSHQLRFADLVLSIKRNLAEQGTFYLLLPYKRTDEVLDVLNKAHLFIYKKITVSSTKTHQPFRIMIRGGHLNRSMQEEALAIHDAERAYTPEFTALLKDYYLYL